LIIVSLGLIKYKIKTQQTVL